LKFGGPSDPTETLYKARFLQSPRQRRPWCLSKNGPRRRVPAHSPPVTSLRGHTRGTGARRNRRASLGLEWQFPYRRSIPSLHAFLQRSRAGGPLSRVSSCSSSEECGRRGMPVEGAAAAWIGSEEMEQAPATLSSR
jgi:hypothetical protein